MKMKELKMLYEMMYPEYPDVVSSAQVAEMLGISKCVAYRLIREGEIKGKVIANAYKIPKVNVINYVTENGLEDLNEN